MPCWPTEEASLWKNLFKSQSLGFYSHRAIASVLITARSETRNPKTQMILHPRAPLNLCFCPHTHTHTRITFFLDSRCVTFISSLAHKYSKRAWPRCGLVLWALVSFRRPCTFTRLFNMRMLILGKKAQRRSRTLVVCAIKVVCVWQSAVSFMSRTFTRYLPEKFLHVKRTGDHS